MNDLSGSDDEVIDAYEAYREKVYDEKKSKLIEVQHDAERMGISLKTTSAKTGKSINRTKSELITEIKQFLTEN